LGSLLRAKRRDPALGRFAQADTLVPEPGNPLAWDRYAYVKNNPVRYSDPTGHMIYNGSKTEIWGLTKREIDENEQKLALLEKKSIALQCESGNKSSCKNISIFPDISKEVSHKSDRLDQCINGLSPQECYKSIKLDMYNSVGIDLEEVVIIPPFHNPLSEFYSDEDLAFWEPEFILNKASGVNVLFLDSLGIDVKFYPNYETLYLDALKIKYSDLYESLLPDINEIIQGQKSIFSITTDMIEDIYTKIYWVTQD
jgi:hypothetical protein